MLGSDRRKSWCLWQCWEASGKVAEPHHSGDNGWVVLAEAVESEPRSSPSQKAAGALVSLSSPTPGQPRPVMWYLTRADPSWLLSSGFAWRYKQPDQRCRFYFPSDFTISARFSSWCPSATQLLEMLMSTAERLAEFFESAPWILKSAAYALHCSMDGICAPPHRCGKSRR